MRLEVGQAVPSIPPPPCPYTWMHLDFSFALPDWLKYFESFLLFTSKHLPDQTLHRLSSSSPSGDATGQKMKENPNRVQRAHSRKGEREHQGCALCRASLTLCKALFSLGIRSSFKYAKEYYCLQVSVANPFVKQVGIHLGYKCGFPILGWFNMRRISPELMKDVVALLHGFIQPHI